MARRYTVTHPTKKRLNDRINGVAFEDGSAEVSGKAAVFWFQRHGYKVTEATGGRPKQVPPLSADAEPVVPDVSEPPEPAA